MKYAESSKITFLCLTFLWSMHYCSHIHSQDTLWVKAFNFQSGTRDSMITFPDGDHNSFEKILMYYRMRCKKGLISTSANRNLGCGEWDYSCNTNIIDSSAVDSLKATHPNYIIEGYNDNFFFYTTKPTYTYTEYQQKNTVVLSQSNVTSTKAGPHQQNTNYKLPSNKSWKSYFILPKQYLNNLTSGNIHGLQLKHNGSGKAEFMRIRLANSSNSSLKPEDLKELDFDEVLNRNTEWSASGTSNFIFHKPFVYDGNSAVIIELSYQNLITAQNYIEISASSLAEVTSYYIDETDYFINLGSQGRGEISADAFSDISNEITVAFWARGNESVLPNNNSILYATDEKGNRQINIHLPWSNSRVYWDCGNDGSGFDRIDKTTVTPEFEGSWQHWAFTKNTTNGEMKIYLNGQLWHSGTGRSKPIDIHKFFIGTDENGNIPYAGGFDDLTIWNKALSAQEIQSFMFLSPANNTALLPFLKAWYNMNEPEGNSISDQSDFGGTGQFNGGVPHKIAGRAFTNHKQFIAKNALPDLSLLRGNFNLTTTTVTQRDSVLNPPLRVRPFRIENSQVVEGTSSFLWQAGIFPVYDEAGEIIDEVEFPEENLLEIEQLVFYRKYPAKYELLSFVTPYGINLDLGKDGKVWVFDVTDYGPVLKNKKRLLLDKGGEWQEELDIRFAFIKGKPARNVLSIHQVWPATMYGYQSVLNNDHLEARDIYCSPEAASVKLRTVSTGHGQEGEFIARTHSLNVNKGAKVFYWQLWKECAENPVYPQGGTWVYDRAGWCPGMPSDLREFEIKPWIPDGSEVNLDYGLNTASGDSRYIVNTQLVQYGKANFVLDAGIEEILAPTNMIAHFRNNPICQQPQIIIRNNGSKKLTSVEIQYGINGRQTFSYQWQGNLDFLQTETITLPALPVGDYIKGNKFTASIVKINQEQDTYIANNTLSSDFKTPEIIDGNLVISIRPNSAPGETSWILRDINGQIIKTSRPNMSPYEIYEDTIKGLDGCYKLQFLDSDQDGISWWANGDGTGFIRAKGTNGNWKIFQPDFGKELTFNFATGQATTTQEISTEKHVSIYPNPVNDEMTVNLSGYQQLTKVQLFNPQGSLCREEIISKPDDTEHKVFFNMSDLPAGLYIVCVVNHQNIQSFKTIKY